MTHFKKGSHNRKEAVFQRKLWRDKTGTEATLNSIAFVGELTIEAN